MGIMVAAVAAIADEHPIVPLAVEIEIHNRDYQDLL
jgi:hypothetical protein